MAVRMFLALLSLSACCAISSAKAADVESFCSGPEDTCHSLLVKHHKVASLKTDLAEEDAQCTHSGEDSSFPQLGGCCSGLAVCNEPRSADDPAYCDSQDSEHDVSCWSTVQMCRSECEQVTCATTEDCVFLGDDQECTDAICQSARPPSLPPPPQPGPSPAFDTQQTLRSLVINLPSRTDRWERIQHNLEPYVQKGVLSFERLQATDAENDVIPTGMVSTTWRTDLIAKVDSTIDPGLNLQMSSGERACSMSHIRAWQIAANRSQPTLILEDDARLVDGFIDRLWPNLVAAGQSDADVLYLSYLMPVGLQMGRHVDPGMFEASYLWLTTGYVVWPRSARKLLEMLPVTDPVDNFLARQTHDEKLRSFAVSVKLIYPAEGRNVASDVVHTSEHVSQYLQQ